MKKTRKRKTGTNATLQRVVNDFNGIAYTRRDEVKSIVKAWLASERKEYRKDKRKLKESGVRFAQDESPFANLSFSHAVALLVAIHDGAIERSPEDFPNCERLFLSGILQDQIILATSDLLAPPPPGASVSSKGQKARETVVESALEKVLTRWPAERIYRLEKKVPHSIKRMEYIYRNDRNKESGSVEVHGTKCIAFVEYLLTQPERMAKTRAINEAVSPSRNWKETFAKNEKNRSFWDAFIIHHKGAQDYGLRLF